MTVFNPDNRAALEQRLARHDGLVIACYCAAWCDTCRAYQGEFNALASRLPAHVFVWIDIEDHPQLLGDDDVENFPTLLIQSPAGNLFFGEQLPIIAHLERLIANVEEGAALITDGPPALRELLANAR